eukprot:Sspe_Gene.10739::Locus_3595_Transcript_1_10_Confidence_0.150_Length_617::g.10739::m.10739
MAPEKCRTCHFEVTGVTPHHCCKMCESKPGHHGPACKQTVSVQGKCKGCDYAVTGLTKSHCCMLCEKIHGTHGPLCSKVPSLEGEWKNDQGMDVTRIEQFGHDIKLTNPQQAWSPSVGVIRGTTVTFKSGGLVGLTGTIDHKHIRFSNGCSWSHHHHHHHHH